MTDKQKLEKIGKCLDKLAVSDMSYDEVCEMVEKMRICDIKESMWEFYCFAEDVTVTLNE